MHEAIIATWLFWSFFIFTAGAFWTTVMAVAKYTPMAVLYKNYLIYLLVGWLPICVVIGLIIHFLGGINQAILIALHFVGALVIVYLAVRVLQSSKKNAHQTFDFNWRLMSLLSWTNPKVWLTIPPGFLVATYTDSVWLNILIFYGLGVPLFLFGVYFWAILGRQGDKLIKEKMAYINALLLLFFALYLVYQGVKLL